MQTEPPQALSVKFYGVFCHAVRRGIRPHRKGLQLEVGKGVVKGWRDGAIAARHVQRRFNPCSGTGLVVELGRCPEPPPDAGWWPLLQEHIACAPRDNREPALPLGYFLTGFLARIGCLVVLLSRETVAGEGAPRAIGSAARATRCAEVHDRLGVVGDPIPRRMLLCRGPEAFTDGSLPRPARKGVIAREYPFDVAVENGCPGVHGQTENRSGGRTPYAGQRLEPCQITGKDTPVRVANVLRAAVQVSRPGVVTQPCPEV